MNLKNSSSEKSSLNSCRTAKNSTSLISQLLRFYVPLGAYAFLKPDKKSANFVWEASLTVCQLNQIKSIIIMLYDVILYSSALLFLVVN